MHLNDAYRDLYRAYREAEDKESQAKWAEEWQAANPGIHKKRLSERSCVNNSSGALA